MSAEGRRRRLCAAALALTIPLGLAWRLAPLHLPPFASKYGGSALWAMAVYWLLAGLLPRRSPLGVGLLAAVAALGVEWLKRLYWTPLDHFRETLAGKLLLGRHFSYGAILAYWMAIATVVWLDSALQLSRGATGGRRAVNGRGGADGPGEDRANTLAPAARRD